MGVNGREDIEVEARYDNLWCRVEGDCNHALQITAHPAKSMIIGRCVPRRYDRTNSRRTVLDPCWTLAVLRNAIPKSIPARALTKTYDSASSKWSGLGAAAAKNRRIT